MTAEVLRSRTDLSFDGAQTLEAAEVGASHPPSAVVFFVASWRTGRSPTLNLTSRPVSTTLARPPVVCVSVLEEAGSVGKGAGCHRKEGHPVRGREHITKQASKLSLAPANLYICSAGGTQQQTASINVAANTKAGKAAGKHKVGFTPYPSPPIPREPFGPHSTHL